MSSPRVLTVDCGASHVSCAVFASGRRGELKLEQFACEPFVLDAAEETRWAQTLTEALRALVTREKITLRECVLAVPGHLALTKFVKIPAVDRAKRPRIVQFEASQAIPYPLGEVSWGHWEISDDGADLDLLLSAAKLDVMERLCRAVEAAGLKVTRAEAVTLALWRAYRWNYAGEQEPLLLVEIGARSTQLLFMAGRRLFARTVPLGGNTITMALAKERQINFSEAEVLKRHALGEEAAIPLDAISRAAVDRAVAVFHERLQLEIVRSRLGYSRQAGATAPEKVLLTGRGSRAAAWAKILAEKLDLPVESYDALRTIELTHREKRGGAEQLRDRLAILVGLAVPAVSPAAPMIDLLPPARRESLQWKRRQPWWLAAAALLLVPMGFPIAYYQLRASRQQEQAAAYEQKLIPMRRFESRNQENLERIGKLRAQAEVISRAAARRTNWLAFMADLQDRLGQVGDVWLERMQVGFAANENTSPEAAADPLRLVLGGRLLDTENPLANASEQSRIRVNSLFKSLRQSPFVRTVENDRFDNSRPGILRFEVTVEINPENPL